jgi:hypothetical protein
VVALCEREVIPGSNYFQRRKEFLKVVPPGPSIWDGA